MLSKQDVRDSIVNEYKIIKQLVSKLPEGAADYRLSPDQRSTIEVLRYLSLLGPGTIHAANDGDFSWLRDNSPAVESAGLAEIPGLLDGAISEMDSLFASMSDEDFQKQPVSIEGMGEWTMGTWLLNTTQKFIPAYKLMVFHHAKAAGNADLGTWDAWLDNGEVPKPQPA